MQPAIKAIQVPNQITSMSSMELDEIQSRHIKGCNCKKSNCLKRYCECYLAKIQCSTLCKCIGCKNCDESTKALLQLANAADMRKQQHHHQQNKFANQLQPNNFNNNIATTTNSKSGDSAFPQQFLGSQTNEGGAFGKRNVISLTNGTLWQKNGALLGGNGNLITNLNIFHNEDDDSVERHNNIDQIKLHQQQSLR